MADAKISQLPVATTPLAGTELMEIVQGGVNKQVATSEVGGGGAVASVNGQTGVVVLDAGDVGADPAGSASTVATNLTNHITDTTDAHDASAISFTSAGNISSTDVQAAIEELDALIAPLTYTTTSTAGGTITLDMASLIQRMFRGTASFATPKTLALSNATNALVFGLLVEITDVAAILTVPADWYMNDINYDGTAWTPPEIGRYELGGTLYGTEWMVKIQGPFS